MRAVRRWLPAKSSRSRRTQSVERTDDARPIVSRRKRMRECRLGTPAGTVPRRDDTRPDTIGEVVDGRTLCADKGSDLERATLLLT